MFLSKKNANHFNKPKNPPTNKRALGGWGDDDNSQEEKQKKDNSNNTVQIQSPSIHSVHNVLLGFEDTRQSIPISEKPEKKSDNKENMYLDWDQLAQKDGIECERKIVEEIVQPGGIRIKPNENLLVQFLKECKGMDIPIIGSLLLSKIEVNYPFPVKAKALHIIQYIVKKNQKYASFFKYHCQKLQEFPQPEDNVDNYRKILKNLITTIGGSLGSKNNFQPEGDILQFVDPGYNEDKKNDAISFIRSNEKKGLKSQTKRNVIGPGETKIKQKIGPGGQPQPQIANKSEAVDILGLDLLTFNDKHPISNNNNQLDLLDNITTEKQPNNQTNAQHALTYDQLMNNMGKPSDFGFN